MSNLIFDPDNTLAGGLYGLTPKEAIALGIGLCAAVEDSVGADGCHGGVWPGNITSLEGQVAVGPAEPVDISHMGPDALEFIAPEQFWNGENSPAADVYSIGLILYTALNGGVMPFFDDGGEHTPEQRATALQSRMKGNTLSYPKSACRELANVILKATSFKAEDRYKNPGLLRASLQGLPEAACVPAVAPVVQLSDKEVETARSYKVDKDFEKTVPDKPAKSKKVTQHVDEDMDVNTFRAKRKKTLWFPIVIIVVAVIAAVILLFKSCSGADTPVVPDSTPTPTVVPTADVTTSPEPVEPTDDPVETPPVETAAPEPTFELYIEDVTWEEASARCQALGGHLATVSSDDDLQNIISMVAGTDVKFIWLGAYRGVDGQWYNVTGEKMEYSSWDIGEPSAYDADGTPENYLLMWYRTAIAKWTFNDMRNDPISVIPATYSGKTAYICQFDQ